MYKEVPRLVQLLLLLACLTEEEMVVMVVEVIQAQLQAAVAAMLLQKVENP